MVTRGLNRQRVNNSKKTVKKLNEQAGFCPNVKADRRSVFNTFERSRNEVESINRSITVMYDGMSRWRFTHGRQTRG